MERLRSDEYWPTLPTSGESEKALDVLRDSRRRSGGRAHCGRDRSQNLSATDATHIDQTTLDGCRKMAKVFRAVLRLTSFAIGAVGLVLVGMFFWPWPYTALAVILALLIAITVPLERQSPS